MIASGAIVSIFLEGLLADMRYGWLKAIIHTQTGHIQVMPKGYLEKEIMTPVDLLVPYPKKIEEYLETQEEVLAYTKRLNFGGMIATQEKTAIFAGIGVDLKNEYEVFYFLKEVKEGTHLSWKTPDGCVIGTRLAKNLGIDIGSIVTLISHTTEGALNAVNVKIVGIFNSGVPEVDSMCLTVPLSVAHQLLDVEEGVSNIICILENMKFISGFKEKLTNFINTNYKKEELEIHPWYDLSVQYNQVMAMQSVTVRLIEFIMFFLIALAICNIMLMSVFERTREIGTLTAFGITRNEVLKLFLSEAFSIGMIGGIIGIILGSLITGIVFLIGIPFVPPGTERIIYMRPMLCLDKGVFVFLLSIITTVIGGLYPASWASKVKPIDALRFV